MFAKFIVLLSALLTVVGANKLPTMAVNVHSKKNLKAAAAVVKTNAAKKDLAASKGFIEYDYWAYDDACTSGGVTVWDAVNVCIQDSDSSSYDLVLDANNDNTITYSTYSSTDCSTAATYSYDTVIGTGSCQDNGSESVKYKSSPSSYSIPGSALSLLQYSSKSNCDNEDLAPGSLTTANAYYIDTCYNFGSTSAKPTSCSDVSFYNSASCSGSSSSGDDDNNNDDDDGICSGNSYGATESVCNSAFSAMSVNFFLTAVASLFAFKSVW